MRNQLIPFDMYFKSSSTNPRKWICGINTVIANYVSVTAFSGTTLFLVLVILLPAIHDSGAKRKLHVVSTARD